MLLAASVLVMCIGLCILTLQHKCPVGGQHVDEKTKQSSHLPYRSIVDYGLWGECWQQ